MHKYEAPALKKALAAHGVDLYIASPALGADITKEVFEAIENSHLFIALATSTYAEDTGNPVCCKPKPWATRLSPRY